ncbi:enolase C-terminal domain-like protein [Pelagicoccus sp. SDUM812005]|uniref:enolase C-terminal domain-like protein n=1 Tax=Pelagicoccus sp. SDUM812005 TaxID=3041257 RepID=UPI00280EB879|nr:enolase C-terminal domain-like protein [Pelagicoccus sp. SDUM812005]MDQ8183099.1 enolase C-terminal domain-like protein [Pelagicoccus sp. SDUM812005]
MIRLIDSRIHFLPINTRMPFRYGIATMTHLPVAFVFLKFRFGKDNADTQWGFASDLLPPRWFKKDPQQSPDAEIEEMKSVLQHALAAAAKLEAEIPFAFWDQLYRLQLEWAQGQQIPPLLANFGTTFVERALLDAFARFQQKPFSQFLLTEKLKVELGPLHPELYGLSAAQLLPSAPLPRIQARHTVGFGDPLLEADISAEDRVADALPQSLETAIQRYGLSQFKVKINGRLPEDLARLQALTDIFARLCPSGYALSLDGNEQFESWSQFADFWSAAQAQPKLRPLLQNVRFIEQPLSRQSALSSTQIGRLPDGSATPPVIIDESDDGPETFRHAIDCGYRGVSHKNCKGIFKGIANRCLIEYRNQNSDTQLFMSGEDLCNIGPVSLQQDLAMQSLLGNASVERNGHHYFYGLSQFPSSVQELLCERHPELYQRDDAGTATLQIAKGEIPTADLHQLPFASGFSPQELAASLGLPPLG